MRLLLVRSNKERRFVQAKEGDSSIAAHVDGRIGTRS